MWGTGERMGARIVHPAPLVPFKFEIASTAAEILPLLLLTCAAVTYTGALDRDHCNARKSISWDRQRNLVRVGRMPEVRAAFQAPQPRVAAAPPAPTKLTGMAKAKTPGKPVNAAGGASATAAAAKASAKKDKSLPAHLEPLPDPTLDPSMYFELGKIVISVKVGSWGFRLSPSACRPAALPTQSPIMKVALAAVKLLNMQESVLLAQNDASSPPPFRQPRTRQSWT